MKDILTFTIESSVILGGAMLIYQLFLNKSALHLYKRLYLLLALAIAVVIPNISFQLTNSASDPLQSQATTEKSNSVLLSSIEVTGMARNAISEAIHQVHWMNWIYIIGFVILFLRTLTALVQIHKMRLNIVPEHLQNYKLYIPNRQFTPFSFFNNIYIPRKLHDQDHEKVVLKHEKEHARQKHSFDVIFIELILIVQWFNPFVWIARKKIKENHEYLVDQAVISSGVHRTTYMKTIVSQATGIDFAIGNNLNVSFTKRRLTMMGHKPASLREMTIVTTASLSLLISLSIFFGCTQLHESLEPKFDNDFGISYRGEVYLPEVNTEDIQPSEGTYIFNFHDQAFMVPNIFKSAETSTIKELPIISPKGDLPSIIYAFDDATETGNTDENTGEVFIVVESMPEFIGGEQNLRNFLNKNIQYPPEAVEQQIEGKVYVMFVVGKDGSVQDAEIGRGVHPLLDEEALRVMNLLPAFKPGTQRGKPVKVSYTVPINFQLQ